MKQVSFLFLLLLLFVPFSWAIDLAEMQEGATQSREIIKRYQTTLEKSGLEVARIRSAYYPSVNIGYQANNLDEAARFEHRQNSSIYAAASMNIFAGFKDRYSIESAQVMQKVDGYRLKGI